MGLFEPNGKLRWLADRAWNDCGYDIRKEGKFYDLYRKPLRRFEDLGDVNISTLEVVPTPKNNYFDQIIKIIEQIHSENETVEAEIFLLHKPVGLGLHNSMITRDNEEFAYFIQYVSSGAAHYKIGFDSCTIPALINHTDIIDIDSLDTCEGARWSAYITADMKILPCSFDNQEQRWAVDLRTYSIEEAWNSREFEGPEIVLCGRKKSLGA